MTPKVSVCIPTFNGERYLVACLQSVAAQTCQDLEILIVDDGSSDATHAIALEFAHSEPRARVLRNDANLGLVGNWNRCVGLARGDWVKFVFQDDLLAPGCVQALVDRTRAGGLLVACSRDFSFEAGTAPDVVDWYLANRQRIESLWGPAATEVSADEVCAATLDSPGANLIGEPTSVMFHRHAAQRVGTFNDSLIMSCDLEYWTRLGVNAGFSWVPERLATFRVHGAATSAVNRSSRAFRMDVLDNLVIQHDFAFAPVYAPLRRAAARRSPPVELEAQFRRTAKWAEKRARQLVGSASDGSASRLAEWQAVADRYPQALPARGLRSLFGKRPA